MPYSEIRHGYMFGPAVEPGSDDPEQAGLFAGVAIDGWKTDDDCEEGTVIAQVLMSAHGDLITAWHDNGARMDDAVLEAIESAKADLRNLWAERKTNKYYYTFGSDPKFPYQDGWVEVRATSWEEAHAKFRARFPDRHEGTLNCAFFYDEAKWMEMDPESAWHGHECHEIIE